MREPDDDDDDDDYADYDDYNYYDADGDFRVMMLMMMIYRSFPCAVDERDLAEWWSAQGRSGEHEDGDDGDDGEDDDDDHVNHHDKNQW